MAIDPLRYLDLALAGNNAGVSFDLAGRHFGRNFLKFRISICDKENIGLRYRRRVEVTIRE